MLVDKADAMLAANWVDPDTAAQLNWEKHLLARLTLTKGERETLAQGVLDISNPPDPIGSPAPPLPSCKGLALVGIRHHCLHLCKSSDVLSPLPGFA